MNPSETNAWRQELQALLAGIAAYRKPALRRSLSDNYLYATDLPLCAEPEACDSFLKRAAAIGWEKQLNGSWINLRKVLLLFPAGWWDSLPAGGEASCLRELTSRHPELVPTAAQAICLIKAAEEGPAALEEACRTVHVDYARRLREKNRKE